MSYERENIRRMSGYVPGEQPEAEDVVKLNTNENPYPPTPAVLAALRKIGGEELRRYPPPTAAHFRAAAAEVHGLEPANILATNGGDELLRLAVTTFVEPGAAIGTTEPSYSLYPVLAAIQDCPVVSVSLDENWLAPANTATRMNHADVRLCFVVNPHAPSGALLDAAQLADLAEALDGLLLIDEAYVDFVDPGTGHDTIDLVRRFDNVLILRSLSKGYGLAGLRFGYGIGSPGLIEPMMGKTRDSYNTDILSQRLATAALHDRAAAAKNWERIRAERDRLRGALLDLGLAAPPSSANFILATAPGGARTSAPDLCRALKDRNIYVRHFDQDRLRDKLRITVGTPAQNDALLDTLRELLG